MSNPRLVWYCLHTQPKREHLAAYSLKSIPGIETISPRIRYRKQTQRGPVWFVESVFPGYIFAGFDYPTQHRQVRYSSAVIKIVQFGSHIPRIDSLFIDYLRSRFDQSEVIQIEPKLEIGGNVTVAEGAFSGIDAIITKVVPAKERIHVLLDFLGRQVHAEMKVDQVALEKEIYQHPLVKTQN